MKRFSVLLFFVILFFCLCVCGKGSQETVVNRSISEDNMIDFSTTIDRGFRIDNIYHSEKGDIHFSSFIPSNFPDEKTTLFITLPGWEGLYFQGVGTNLKYESFASEALEYDDNMIVLAPQLNDWGETSAKQTIALTEYFVSHYNVDPDRVLLNGYSGGGETGSIAVGKRPDLFSKYLMVSSKWDGAYDKIVENKTPIYFFIGENDEYYGSASMKAAYSHLVSLYESKGYPADEIMRYLVLDVKPQNYFSARNYSNQHGGGLAAATDENVMNWLFK